MVDEPNDDGLTAEEKAALDEDDAAIAAAAAGETGIRDAIDPAASVAALEEVVEPEAPEAAPLPLIRGAAPEKADELLASFDAEDEALNTKFDEGDITAKEFRDGLKATNARREEIKWEQKKAALAEEMSESQRFNQWAGAVRDFMSTTGSSIAKSNSAMIAFDVVVKGVTSDEKYNGMSDKKKLETAYKMFTDDYNKAFGKAVATGATTDEAVATATKAVTKAAKVIPPTLARVPASDIEATDLSPYGALDRLADSNPIEYERRLGELSERDRATYLATA